MLTSLAFVFLAGLAAGVWSSPEEITGLRRSERVFEPQMDAERADGYYRQWQRALQRALKWEQN